MNWIPLFIIVAVVILILCVQKCSLNCGPQDENWIQSQRNFDSRVGPDYGDPVAQFADQIEAYRAEFKRKADAIGCGQACMKNNDACIECFDSRETLVIGIMPLDTPNPKPGYKSQKKNPPWVPPRVRI